MNRYKRRGWFGDSHRHYLAAKGVKTVNKVDLKKYAGKWKQKSVKNEPWFQKGCEDVSAEYTALPNGNIKVVNRCKDKDGNVRAVEGTAYSVSDDNKKLVVQFGNSIFRTGKYEIVKVNPEYTKATVKGGKTVWELERPKSKKYMAVKADDPDYVKWRKLVNMSPAEVESFADSPLGKKAGLSRKEAAKKGIRSGRDSARAIVRMRRKPLSKWTDGDEEWMERQNSFVARMKGNKGPLYKDGKPTRKLTSLKIWGHDPQKKVPWQGGGVHPDYGSLKA